MTLSERKKTSKCDCPKYCRERAAYAIHPIVYDEKQTIFFSLDCFVFASRSTCRCIKSLHFYDFKSERATCTQQTRPISLWPHTFYGYQITKLLIIIAQPQM